MFVLMHAGKIFPAKMQDLNSESSHFCWRHCMHLFSDDGL